MFEITWYSRIGNYHSLEIIVTIEGVEWKRNLWGHEYVKSVLFGPILISPGKKLVGRGYDRVCEELLHSMAFMMELKRSDPFAF